MAARSFFAGAAVLAFSFLAEARTAQTDPASELKSFSVFQTVGLTKLAEGDAKAVRGAPMKTSRFLSVQSAWVTPRPPAQVAAALRRWSREGGSELGVSLHRNGSNFSGLSQAPNKSAVQAFVSATTSKSPELQISKTEAAKLTDAAAGSTMSGTVANFWSGVLSGRSRKFAAGGISSQPAYDYSAQAIRPAAEINGLLNEQAKIRRKFSGI